MAWNIVLASAESVTISIDLKGVDPLLVIVRILNRPPITYDD